MSVLRGFADIPGHVRDRVSAGEPVLLILLDAFGRVFLERHRTHPLVRCLAVTELDSQFPSTTTAHVTTLHFGLPVGEHGLYEWSVYEPTLDTIIQPLPFRRSGDADREALAGILDPRALLDTPTFYASLPVPSRVIQPVGLDSSSYSRLATAGAALSGSDDLGASVATLLDDLAAGRIGYGQIYWPDIDTTSHRHGPDSPEVAAAIRHALDAIETAVAAAPPGVTVLITADHGQIAVHPDRVDFLDVLWPELGEHLTQPRPAGSPRDVFLHVRRESLDVVLDALANRLEGRAEVYRAAELFPAAGPRLRARLGDVAILAAPGRTTWLASTPVPALENLGTHGGTTAVEAETHLSELRT